MPPARVPAISDVAAKFGRRASSATAEYEAGVRNPSNPWAAAATAAQPAYEQGVQQAIARKAFGKGVAQAGDARWQKGAVEKGPGRFTQGVSLAQPDYERAMGPILDAIARVDLPPRGPRGSAANLQRMTPIPAALAALKRK
jgi:hypothetical protein